jgi:SRSO17 transposase
MEYKYDKTPLYGTISDYGESELQLHKVDETKWEKHWDKLVKEQHYLGFEGSMGGRVKYIITLGSRIIGAISFSSAVYQLGPRDAYIGWDSATRVSMLSHLVNNNRFLILPEIKIRNLASRILSMSLRRMQKDWEKQYEVRPYMVETFVDKGEYLGTCYKASNWTYLGSTKGYGKKGTDFVHHGRKKDLYVYILDSKFAKQFRPDISRAYNEKEELRKMLNGTPMWYPSLLKEIGITDGPAEKITQMFIEHLLRYTPMLGRSENKLHFTTMVQGLLSDLKRKSIEPIAIAFQGIDSVRNLTNFMSRSKWDDAGMLAEKREELSELLAHEEGMLTGDNTSNSKKGNHSVGVARQYCGNTGKIDNCQTGVMLGYASTKGYGLIDYGLYMPQKWFDNEYASLREKCGVPGGTKFKTKNTILLKMMQDAVESGVFPAKYVGIDAEFGSDSSFLDGLPDSLIYFADVRKNQSVYDVRPSASVPTYSGKGRKPTKVKTDAAPLTVKEAIENSDEPWERVVLGIGAKGPIIAEDKCLRITELRDELPGKDVWLYARKLDDGAIKYALCNAPGDASKNDIRKPALMRWSIEQCFKECKDYLGMDHYESRSWDAWHRHILLTLIAHLFIIKLRIEFSRKPNTPNATPYVTSSVSLEDYLDAHMKLLANNQIEHPDIFPVPPTAQQFLTIGLIQKLINATFPKVGLVVEEVNYLLSKAASAFNSHSLTAVNNAMALRPLPSG